MLNLSPSYCCLEVEYCTNVCYYYYLNVYFIPDVKCFWTRKKKPKSKETKYLARRNTGTNLVWHLLNLLYLIPACLEYWWSFLEWAYLATWANHLFYVLAFDKLELLTYEEVAFTPKFRRKSLVLIGKFNFIVEHVVLLSSF